MELNVHSIEYTISNDKPIIHIFGRDKNNKKHHFKYDEFKPYFYVFKDDKVPSSTRVKNVKFDENYVSVFGDELKRIYTKLPSDVRDLRGSFKDTFEADILFPDRFAIDHNITSGFNIDSLEPIEAIDFGHPRIAYLDIETASKRSRAENPIAPITCITIYDNYTDKYFTLVWRKDIEPSRKKQNMVSKITGKNLRWFVFKFDSEKTMLKKFIAIIKKLDPDIFTGWNVKIFDIQYIINRCSKLELSIGKISSLGYVKCKKNGPFLDIKVPGRSIFDLMAAYKILQEGELDSFTLESVAQKELKTGKLKEGVNTWQTDLKKHIEYNFLDVELTVELDKRNYIISFFDQLRKVAGCRISDAFRMIKKIDMQALHFVHNKYILPTQVKGKKKEFKGAHVDQPESGLYEFVMVFDLKSLYPSAVISANMSPETKDPSGDIKLGNGICFDSEVKGIVPQILISLFKERDRTKALRQSLPYKSKEWKIADDQDRAIKELMNSYYGVLSNPYFRLFDVDVASSITWFGRTIKKYTKKVLEEKGLKVIYGDTDSVFVLSPKKKLENIITLGNKITKYLNKKYSELVEQYGIKEHRFVIEFEKVFRRLFFLDVKKRYAGKLMWIDGKESNKNVIMGFDSRRSDNSAFSRKMQRKLLDMIVNDSSKREIVSYITDCIKSVREKETGLKDIGIPKGIKKPLDAYEKQKSPWIIGAKYSNDNLDTDFGEETKPRLLYVKNVKKYPSTSVVCFEDDETLEKIKENFEVDYELMIDKIIRAKVEGIIEALGMSWADIETGSTQNEIDI